MGVGWYIAGCVVLGVMGGLWLDGKLHTNPWFAVLGLFLGLGVAFWGVYRVVLPFWRESRDKKGK